MYFHKKINKGNSSIIFIIFTPRSTYIKINKLRLCAASGNIILIIASIIIIRKLIKTLRRRFTKINFSGKVSLLLFLFFSYDHK